MKPLRFLALLPAVIAIPSLIRPLLWRHLSIEQLQLFVSPRTAIGLVMVSLVWFLYISGYKYGRQILLGHALIFLPLSLVTAYVERTYGDTALFGQSLRQPGSHVFMFNLVFCFVALYVIQFLSVSGRRTKLVVNVLLAAILAIALMSISGHIYNLDESVSGPLLMPIPPTAIAAFICLALVVLAHTNHMRQLYLNKRIAVSFLLMLIAVVGANTVVYRNLSRTAAFSTAINASHMTLEDVYNVDLYLNTMTASGRSYELTGKHSYVDTYEENKRSYLHSMNNIAAKSKTQNAEIQSSVQAISAVGTKIMNSNDQIIALKQQNTLAPNRQSALDTALDSYMDEVFLDIKAVSSLYANQVGSLVSEEAASGRGIVTGVSISSTLSILLIIFTPLLIRQTISELSNIQEKLRLSYKKLSEEKSRTEAVLVSIGDGIFTVDTDHTITLFNKAAEKITGVKASDVIGKKYEFTMQNIAAERGGTAKDFIADALAGKETHVRDYEAVLTKTGRHVDLEITASPIRQSDNAVIGAISVFRDRTSERALEVAKDEFVSLASHQLRTPATATKQFLAMFLQGYAGTITDQQRVFLQEAYDNNELGITIIEELLNVARLESGRIQLKKEPLDLAALVRQAALQHQGAATKAKQHLVVDIPDQPVMVQADSSLIGMVVDNLISNALKYSFQDDTVTVSIVPGRHVILKVSDTGVGIKPADMPKLFTRFGRLEDPHTQHVSGTGIGLYLIRKIADMHHAKIQVESEYGKGTTFIFTFNVS